LFCHGWGRELIINEIGERVVYLFSYGGRRRLAINKVGETVDLIGQGGRWASSGNWVWWAAAVDMCGAAHIMCEFVRISCVFQRGHVTSLIRNG